MPPGEYVVVDRGVRVGWGKLWPDYMGAFNLLWLLSGVSLPPPNYPPYLQVAAWVAAHSHYHVGGMPLAELAALRSLPRFERTLLALGPEDPALAPIQRALVQRAWAGS